MTVPQISAEATCLHTEPESQQLEDAFLRYQDELLGTVYYLVGNMEDARDALQETFIKCWRHQEMLDEVRNLKAWIFRIAMNTGRDMRQTAWRRHRRSLPDDAGMIEASGHCPSVLAERSERLSLLQSAVQQLRNEERQVFLLRQRSRMTYQEIGHAIGIPTGTVKTRMRLAVAKLRQTLN